MVFLPRSCSTGYIWIDQICINQQDDTERGHQIALMGEIYSSARQVLVWLGPGLGVGNDTGLTSACSEGSQPIIVDDSDTELEDLMGSDGVHDLFENEWFQRAWVVQEFCLARSKRALIGAFSIRWEVLVSQVNRPRYTVDSRYWMDRVKVILNQRTYIEWSGLKQVAENKPRELCGFMARYSRRFKASDPKDKVHAFLGLWRPPHFDTTAATRKEETAANVYTRFATALIKHTNRLDVLAAVDHKPPGREGSSLQDALPSWVPNWEYDPPLSHSPIFQHQLDMERRTYEWKASRSRNHKYQFESSIDAELRTRGRILWKIGHMSQLIKELIRDPDNLKKTRQALGLDSGGLSIAISDALRILLLCKALKRAVNFTDFKPGLKGPRGIAIIQQYFLDAKLGSKTRSQVEGLPECDRSLEEDNSPLRSEDSDESNPDGSRVFRLACDYAFYNAVGRRLFDIQRPKNEHVQGDDDQFGLGPGCIETGDEIAILHGADFPVVLRKIEGREQRYKLIGDCYVDGVMFGEAVDWEEEDADDIIII